jgi:hypothetical protein
MPSSLIGTVHQAHQYAQQPERIRLERLEVTIQGEYDDHQVTYDHGRWTCVCHFFAGWGLCAHTMAVEQLLGPLGPNAQTFVGTTREPAITIGEGTPVD